MLTFDPEKTFARCQCGCGGTVSKGKKFKAYHRVKSPYEYIVGKNGCWVWQRGKTSAGYGEKGGIYAHRYYYEVYKGPIPNGYEIDHLCRNKSCVNPNHLEAVPRYVNSHRGCGSRLTEGEVIEIKRLLKGRFLNTVQIGKLIGCSNVTVGTIKRGKRWKRV